MKCLVTGATGFIGRALCPELASRGHEVLAISRGVNAPACADVLVMDLARGVPDSVRLEGVDAVIHLAGIAHQKAAAQQYQQVNRDATLALARAAQAAGVRHFIFVSSVKAMGPAQDGHARGEDDVFPTTDPYGQSKWQAELGLQELAAGGEMAVTILRPALVYGAAPKGNLALLDRGVDFGLPRPPEEGGRSMIGLPDLVDLLCQLATSPGSGTHTWIVSDGESYSSRTVHDALRARRGAPVASSWCPRWVWMAGARMLGARDKLFGFEHYDNSALLAATDWRPQSRLQDVLARKT
ncbi:NAD-dependent epimerase/dehydratase family protein [Halioglobus maricola]|uniref:NAD-dependent epimerase/dehydratase family protein n=1 Tax=Halioglobus maricola TaxID=2601894 RepID=A0A5P9NK37_9GAMM|nr:NAD-dependent epimerase/dehydratase family protein [Halioglobus maricola]QFU75338.1 NAD-dependent epimerase/dehydratase family protein [Halioglobus maricola]